MLSEIACSMFTQGKITFNRGLNIILGDDDAKNSIGKSTALMLVDFAHGGKTFLEDTAGAINALGHHTYNFKFLFDGRACSFSRTTDQPDVVHICDQDYTRLSEISLDVFRRKLKELYGLECMEGSFRSIVGPFARIWGKGGLEPDQPFVATAKEAMGTAIGRLIDLFGRSSDIAAEKKVLDEQKERKKLIASSMSAQIIPNVSKSEYLANIGSIKEQEILIGKLKQGFTGALSAYETLFDESLRETQQRKNDKVDARNDLLAKVARLQREISGITPRLTANIALITDFFPNVNVQRIEQIEAFHQKIGSIVKKELKDELNAALIDDKQLSEEILALENTIRATLESKGMPDDVFNRVFELKSKADKATEENKFFEQKLQLEDSIKLCSTRLEAIYSRIFLDIESMINGKLGAFNNVVYGPKRNSSRLRIKSASSYSFTSPDDTGTGKSYAGLIGFDLALLALTRLPFVIHDSVIYKNIEVAATIRILRILSFLKAKQLFLSFDEAKKFGVTTELILAKFTVLKLGNDDLLYIKDWRESK
jgi:hypothetical protein